MPYVELPEDLAESLADSCGIYGAHDEETCNATKFCRVCWTWLMAGRIRGAVENERMMLMAESYKDGSPTVPSPAPPDLRAGQRDHGSGDYPPPQGSHERHTDNSSVSPEKTGGDHAG